jgi:predicted DNA-binding ribbon-helix-helix protein
MPQPKAPRGKSLVFKRGVRLNGHKTSVSVETAFWDELKAIADAQGVPVGRLIATIDSERRERQHPNLPSAVRLFVLEYYRWRGHLQASNNRL